MNLFNFNNKQSYMDFVQTLSDEELNLQRKLMLNLLDKIESRYHDIKLNIELTVIPSLKSALRMKNVSKANEYFKQLLKDFFDMHMCEKEFFTVYLKTFSDCSRDDSNFNREDSIKLIDETFDKITSEDESGCYDKSLSLSNLIINQSAIVMYRLYNVALLNEEELKPFLSAPKVLFGGLNEKGEPDLKYSVRRYMYQIQFDIKFVENDF